MATDQIDGYYRDAEKMDIKEIRKKLIRKDYKNDIERKVYESVLKNKEIEENRQIAKDSISIASNNARASKYLFRATFALVLVTAIVGWLTISVSNKSIKVSEEMAKQMELSAKASRDMALQVKHANQISLRPYLL